MTWAYDLKKPSYHLNQVFFKFDVLYHVLLHIPYLLKQSTMGKPRFKKIPSG